MQVFGTPGDDWVIAVGVLLIMLLTMVVALIIAPGTPMSRAKALYVLAIELPQSAWCAFAQAVNKCRPPTNTGTRYM
jgi:hypothetical protein